MYTYAYKVYICIMLNELTKKELETIRAIRNYLIKHGRMPSVRELMVDLKYKSPNVFAFTLSRSFAHHGQTPLYFLLLCDICSNATDAPPTERMSVTNLFVFIIYVLIG